MAVTDTLFILQGSGPVADNVMLVIVVVMLLKPSLI